MGLIRPFPCVTNKRATEKQVFFPPLTKSLTIAQIGDDNFSKAYPEIPDKFTWLTTVERSGRVFPEESTCSSSERVLSRSLSSCAIMADDNKKRLSYWYFGGLASAGAACCTHPLDLLKVTLQTQQEGKISLLQLTGKVVRTQGVLALYNGLSASLLRQLTYSTTRFGIYEVGKQAMGNDSGFLGKAALAGAAGAAGGFVGTPADMVNVRMQNDIKLPVEQRRNYKNAIDGLFRVYREEGFARLFSGASTATSRAVFMTIGQLSFYDLVKDLLLKSGHFGDNLTTHFLSSLTAGAIATTLTQPLDVLKTRAMNAKPGEFSGVWDIVRFTARLGPLGFFKGYVPAFVRLGPHTILTFVFLEQLRLNFGYLKPETKSN
ncbi:mitochondrial dicarboxylate carrier-like isoform X1 [Anopheles albimanus]|nr:mitochondrial dicarboxylate carrier-like isoform X1 [Anopheles albimanus]